MMHGRSWLTASAHRTFYCQIAETATGMNFKMPVNPAQELPDRNSDFQVCPWQGNHNSTVESQEAVKSHS